MTAHPPAVETRSCFHCGLPVDLESPPTRYVSGKNREFCCHACKAVCDAIVKSGNEKYYEYRDQPAVTGLGVDLDAWLNKLSFYDNPDIQKDFVRQVKNGEEAWLILENIHCPACLWLNERHIRQLDGVLACEMDYTSQQAKVQWDPRKIKLSDILVAISQIGYVAHPFDPTHREALQEEQRQRSVKRLIFALILGMTVMNFSLASYVFGAPDASGEYPLWIRIARWTNLLVTGLLLTYSGQLFFRNAWNDLKHRRLGMDAPVALGLSLAWLASFKSTITGVGEVYFESIAMFVVFLLIARYVELRARVDATTLLDETAKIIPKTARRMRGEEVEEVFVADLKAGDIVRLRPGETVPTDGILLNAESSFDESLLSGESLPVHKGIGDLVPGGSVNVDQTVTIEVSRSSANSTLTEIQQLARSSVNDKPGYVQVADAMAGKFIAVILSVATLTFLLWMIVNPDVALSHTIAVLIVTCPCALALAAPVALTFCGAGLAKSHIIPVRMSAIETVAKSNVMVLDKTGTLTQGKPVLQEIISTGTFKTDDLLHIAAALESGSEHPWAKAFLSACPTPSLIASDKVNQPGKGVEGIIGNKHWKLGNIGFVPAAHEWAKSSGNARLISKWQKSGVSLLYLGDDRSLAGVFLLVDPLREGVRNFLRDARNQGFQRVIVLSGDHQDSTRAIASSAGIEESHGGLPPSGKLAFVQQLQKEGNIVMMLGDGINDAPVLASSNISMTISDATDLARSHSDFVILRHDFRGLNSALKLMKKTRKIIIQNLAWAAGYNLLAVPAAAVGLITPWMAAIGMTSSSLIVVVNSLRLKRFLNHSE